MKWLQLVYRVPAEPTRKRTYVWHQLRGLAAVYLQDGCCMLPRTAGRGGRAGPGGGQAHVRPNIEAIEQDSGGPTIEVSASQVRRTARVRLRGR